MTKEDVFDIAKKEGVEFIRLQFTDMFGMLKNIAVTASQLERALDGKCMFDGSSVDGFVCIEESDMYLKPDLDTFEIFPWRPQQGKVARVFCDIYTPDGKQFSGDPRYILKKYIEKAGALGFNIKVGPECEFFLFHTDEHGDPTTDTKERAGYFDVGPLDLAENVRRDIVMNMEDMGYELEASHHEAAPAQHEIDFKYADALYSADEIMTFRMAVRVLAKRHGLHATFMPKPKEGVSGSGMHINISLTDNAGKNLFADSSDKNGLSTVAYSFMAGVLSHIKEMMLITNPIVNSYKRLVPGFDAPIYISWSAKPNRSALVRIPSQRGEDTRIELRCPDSACNPYLALAVIIAAGLDGIEKGLSAPESIEANMFDSKADVRLKNVDCLPTTLGEAIGEFKKSEFARQVLGEHTYNKYIEAKQLEWDRYNSSVSSWETEEYLYRY